MERNNRRNRNRDRRSGNFGLGPLFENAGDTVPLIAGADRLPPHNLDAEQGLLASCILNPAEVLMQTITEKVTPEYFYKAEHQIIYKVLVQLNAEIGNGVDEITLAEALRKDGASEIATYVDTLVARIEVTAHAPHWRKIVREKYFLRRLIETAQTTVERAYEPDDDLQHLLDTVEREFFAISQDRVSSESTVHVAPVMDEAMQMLNDFEKYRGEVAGVPTGFKKLDEMCCGFQEGQMIVVAARPGMGKTSIALNFIEAALFNGRFKRTADGIDTKAEREPVPTLMFSLEMPARELAMRLLCSRASANLQDIRSGWFSKRGGKEKMADVVNAVADYKKMPLYIDDQGGQTILEIRAKARRFVQRHHIGLIVIDYLQLINGTDNSVSREQQIAEASRSIKAMAKEFRLPVIALAQLNRKNEDENRPPRISDLRESGSIEQDADMVLLIDRQRKGVKKAATRRSAGDDEEEEETTVDNQIVFPRVLIVAKQRNGPTGEVPLNFIRAQTKFTEPAKERSGSFAEAHGEGSSRRRSASTAAGSAGTPDAQSYI